MAKLAAMEEREERQRKQQQKEELLRKYMGSVFRDTCQSNFDCDQPEACCDFGFKKVCCPSGNTNRDIEKELLTIPVPRRG